MSTYSNRLQPALQNLLQCVVWFFYPRSSCTTHISPDVFGGKKSLVMPATWQKTCNYIKLFDSSTRDRHARRHLSADVQRLTLNASFMTISGGRTKQLDIFCHVTGLTSDFFRFVVVERIRFFHRAFVVPGSYHDAKPVHKRLPVTDWTSAAVACLWRCWWEQQVHHSMLCNVCLCCKFTCVNVDVNHEHIESLDWTGIWRTGTAVCVLRKMIWSDWQWWVARANNMRSCAVSTANRPCWDNKSTNRWVCERVIKVKM